MSDEGDHERATVRGHRTLRGLGGFLGEAAGEAVLAVVSLALFAVVSAAAVYGWEHDRALLVGVVVVVGAFLAYGVRHLVRVARNPGTAPWPRLAAAAAGMVVVVVVWVVYVLSYR